MLPKTVREPKDRQYLDDNHIRVVVISATSSIATEHLESDNLLRTSGPEEGENLIRRQAVSEIDFS